MAKMDVESPDIILPEIDEFSCRICFQSSETNHSFRDTTECSDGLKELREIYIELTMLQINDKEDIRKPNKLCQDCANKLIAAYEFICEAKRAEQMLSFGYVQKEEEEFQDHRTNEIFPNDEEILQERNEYCVEFLLPDSKETDTNAQDNSSVAVVVNEAEFDCESKDGIDNDDETDVGQPFDEFEVLDEIEIDEQFEVKGKKQDGRCLRNTIGSRLSQPTNLIYICDQCQRSFAKEESLIRHKAIVHTYAPREEIAAKQVFEQNINCEYCPRTFMHKNDLQRHVNALHPEAKSNGPKNQTRQYKKGTCPHCGQEFPLASLKIHIRRHLGVNPYKCDECQKAFPRKQDLTIHIRQHTGERPHVCSVCGKSFVRPNKLARHMRIHLGIRPYKCDECGKSFSQSNDLKIHVRRHTGEKPYACYCGESFISGTALRAHRKLKNHNDQVDPDPYEVCRINSRHRATLKSPITMEIEEIF